MEGNWIVTYEYRNADGLMVADFAIYESFDEARTRYADEVVNSLPGCAVRLAEVIASAVTTRGL